MLSLESLPTLNAGLNLTSAGLLIFGYQMIQAGRKRAHGISMGSALLVSLIFLISYLYYHQHHEPTRFLHEGWIRPVYFGILISHTVLAALVPPLALVTVYRALKGEWVRHRRLAKWTFPIWLYVSVTGVLIYGMLYHL